MTKDLLPSPHPLTPPRSEEDWVIWLRLLRSRRVGPATFYRLVTEYGSAKKALDALPEVARAAGVKDYAPFGQDAAIAELQAGRRCGARLISAASPDYPSSLKDLPDAPPLLWALGNIDLLQKPQISLVGARNASSLGTRMARRLAEGLSNQRHVVVSGLARGIDTAAHLGALAGGTIAVFAGGADVVYPTENAVLAQQIEESGLILAEQPIHTRPIARHFPMRNRIISGLSKAVVVVEAAAKSGSLITARNALDQGRDVLAVPGHPLDGRAYGCNLLIRDGATLVRSVDDVLEAISQVELKTPKAPPNHTPVPKPRPSIRELHAHILGKLGPNPVAEDQLMRDINATPEVVTPELVQLEIQGKITRQSGGLIALA